MSLLPEATQQAARRTLGELLLSDLTPGDSLLALHLVVTATISAAAGPDRERRRLAAALWCETLREMVAQMPVEAG